MAYIPQAILTGPAGAEAISSISVTETLSEGWQWQAELAALKAHYTRNTDDIRTRTVGTDGLRLIDAADASTKFDLLISDGAHALHLPPLALNDISEDLRGRGNLSGIDEGTRLLTLETNAGSAAWQGKTSTAAIIQHIKQTALSDTSSLADCYGNAISSNYVMAFGEGYTSWAAALQEVLECQGYEWRFSRSASGPFPALELVPVNFSAVSPGYSESPMIWHINCPWSGITRRRDYTQRRTKLEFQKTTPGVVTGSISNQGRQWRRSFNFNVVNGTFVFNNYTSNSETWTQYDAAMQLPSPIRWAKIDKKPTGFNVYAYKNDPTGTDAPGTPISVHGTRFAGERNYLRIQGELTLPAQGFGLSSAPSTAVAWPPVGLSVSYSALPFANVPDNYELAFNYVYDSGQTPELAAESVITGTLWTSRSQLAALAPMYLWDLNRQSHQITYSGPLQPYIRAGHGIKYSGLPPSVVDSVTHSIGGGTASTTCVCSVLGDAQW